jgi:RHH-type transcriptional regulator, rel operon repressor / antitoxin RelB
MYSFVFGGFMAGNTVMTLRLEPGLRRQLDELAKAQRRSRSFIAAEAIREYVAVNQWQIEETQKALQEADRGEFATDEQVALVMSKWTGKRAAGQEQARRRSRARRAG